jgi:polysaccharide biosynthesis/export protein
MMEAQRKKRLLRLSLYIRSVAVLLAGAGISYAQQGLQMQDLGSTPSTTRGQQCDDRFSPCMDQSQGFQSNYPAYNYNPRPYDDGISNPYYFGTGQPLNMNAPDSERTFSNDQNRSLPPEPPTEFQRFVSADIGKMLPLYGSQFFTSAPATFAPLDKVPVTSGYVVGPGDELLLRAWGSITFYLRETVDRSGNIYIPHIGLIQVSGITFADLHNYLYNQISSSFKKFELSVEMGHLRSIQVFVVGRTRRPGSYTVSSLSSLVNVLFISGGPSNIGSLRHIQVRRGDKIVTQLDLYSFLLNGDKSKDIQLLPGDVIYIPAASGHVALTGSVSQPSIFEIQNGETIGDVLTMAGGLTSLATATSGELERIDPHGTRHVIEVHFDQDGLQMPVKDGDILRVLSIVPKFDNAVTLRGNVANPGRYTWHLGMRIKDLIPDKDSLITRDYWKKKNNLVYVRSEQETPSPVDNTESQTKDHSSSQESAPALPKENIGHDNRTDDNQASTESSLSLQGLNAPDSSSKSPGMSVTDNRTVAEQVGAPSGHFDRANNVELRSPEIDWDYAVIERMDPNTLTTALKPFNLGRLLLDNDDAENFELRPGDIVTIFSQADIHVPQARRTKFVRLEGEFKGAGVYSVQPGETLRQLVKRAGGLTSQAYLYGSSFTRESTRRQQQARLDEYYVQLEQEIDRASAERSNSAVNVQEAATLSASLESQRALADKLRLLRATGRIVLNIPPSDDALDAIPDLPLEDGDSFVVPSRPSSVSVVGSVYDQNAFIFDGSKKANDYLQLAGGITKNGDDKHAFIMRADGSVVSRKSNVARSRGGLEALAMNPGDAIVVPEVVNKTTLLRGLTDWSSIFSQFGLGAAAINVLH